MNKSIAILTLVGLMAGGAEASVIDIDSQKDGCSQCSGPNNILPGTTVSIYSPKVQLTLGPGTYAFTNADPNGTDYWSAWNFQGYPSSGNWAWSFVVANDANSVVLMDDYISGVYSTQAGAANATGVSTWDGNTQLSGTSAAGFADKLVLGSTTTLDFLIDDYGLGDNGGGVALNVAQVTGAPEPGTWALCAAGLAAVLARRRKR